MSLSTVRVVSSIRYKIVSAHVRTKVRTSAWFSRDTTGHLRPLDVHRHLANPQLSGHFRTPTDTTAFFCAHTTGQLGVKRSWVRVPPARQKTCSTAVFSICARMSASAENKIENILCSQRSAGGIANPILVRVGRREVAASLLRCPAVSPSVASTVGNLTHSQVLARRRGLPRIR